PLMVGLEASELAIMTRGPRHKPHDRERLAVFQTELCYDVDRGLESSGMEVGQLVRAFVYEMTPSHRSLVRAGGDHRARQWIHPGIRGCGNLRVIEDDRRDPQELTRQSDRWPHDSRHHVRLPVARQSGQTCRSDSQLGSKS